MTQTRLQIIVWQNQLTSGLVHVPRLGLSWCLVPKVASTSISSLLLPHLRSPPSWCVTIQIQAPSPLSRSSEDEDREYPFPQLEVWRLAGHLQYHQYLRLQNSSPSLMVLVSR